MRETMSFVTSLGAFAPGMSTEPITRSESHDRAVEVERVGGRGLDAPLEVVVEVAAAAGCSCRRS